MPSLSKLMLFTYPAQGDDPYFDSFVAFVGDIDAESFAEADNNNLIATGSALFTWDATAGILSWDSNFFFSGFTTPFYAEIQGPQGSPPLLLNAGAGNVNVGRHSYLVTFVDGLSNETTGGPAAAITLNTASQVSITAIPIGPGGTVKRRIYRTQANASSYLLLTTINDNVTTTFLDNVLDSSLGAAPPNTVLISQISIQEGQVIFFTMPRGMQANTVVQLESANMVANSQGILIYDQIVVCTRRNNIIYFRNGVALSDGESGPVWERPAPPGAMGLTSAQLTAINAALHTHQDYLFGPSVPSNVLTFPNPTPETVERVEVFRNGSRLFQSDVSTTRDFTVNFSSSPCTVTLTLSPLPADKYYITAQISQTVSP